ncbi:MAG: glycosyltransferase [Ignavibacteria bacterium]|nr:glycosyltransferase [Ignavibacteria bacterium]
MVIIVCCLKYEYGFPERGLSFEYYNFLDTLKKMDGGKHKVIHFPFDVIFKKFGRNEMNNRLIDLVKQYKPNLVFFFLYSDEFKKDTLLFLKGELGVTTFNWFADDHWRFYNFSRFWAPYFTYVSTTDNIAWKKYKEFGINNVIKTQWGYNHYLYKVPEGYDFKPRNYDVSFIGQKHSNRGKYISFLRKKGLDVKCWGKGWEQGRINFDEMLNIFRSSKINLNFSNSSAGFQLQSIAKILLTRRIDNRIRFHPLWKIPYNLVSIYRRLTRKQIKGRVFEITGSGGFLLTQNAENLSEYFVDGKEIAVFENEKDLLEKINFYLSKEDLRCEIAYNGYKRALNEHTYEKRFKEIFDKIGLNDR